MPLSPQEQQELDQLNAEAVHVSGPSGGLTPSEQRELDQLNAEAGGQSFGGRIKGALFGSPDEDTAKIKESFLSKHPEYTGDSGQEKLKSDYKANLPAAIAAGGSMLLPIPGTALARVAMAGGSGGTVGALEPAGSPMERLKNAGKGVGLGLALGTAGEGVAAGAGALGKKLASFAEKKAFKSLGPYQRQAIQNSDDINEIGRTLLKEGVVRKMPTSYEGLAARAESAQEIKGSDLERIVEALSQKEGIPSLSRKEIASAIRSDLTAGKGIPGAGARNKKIGRLVSEFESAGEQRVPLSAEDDNLEELRLLYGKPEAQSVAVTPPKTISAELPPPFSRDTPTGMNAGRQSQVRSDIQRANLSAANEAKFDPYDSLPEVLVSAIDKRGTPRLSLKDARALKQEVKKQINWNRLPGADVPIDEEVNRSLYTQLRKGEDDIATRLAEEGAIPNAAQFLDTKKTYGHLATAGAIAGRRGEKEFANRILGLTDYGTGAAGAAIGSKIGAMTGGHAGAKVGAAVGGAGGALANKLARTYGNQVLASGSDSLSRAAALASGLIKESGPAAAGGYKFQDSGETLLNDPVLMQILSENPELIDKFTNPKAKEAAQRRISRKPGKNEIRLKALESE